MANSKLARLRLRLTRSIEAYKVRVDALEAQIKVYKVTVANCGAKYLPLQGGMHQGLLPSTVLEMQGRSTVTFGESKPILGDLNQG